MTWDNKITGHGTMDPLDLIPNPNNWRKHPKSQAKALEGALEEIGWLQDVIVNENTGRLLDGHLRVELAKKHGEEHVPVKFVNLTEEEEELALITLDPITAMAETDKELLNGLIERCKTDNEDVKNLLQSIAEKEKLPIGKKSAQEDDYEPPAEIETDIIKGDIFQLGRHRVMCGDSTCQEDVERLMDGKKSDMVFTDPPYNVDYGGNKKRPSWKIRSINGDKQNPAQWESFCKALFKIIKDYNIGDIYLWGASSPEGMKMRLWLIEMGANWSATIIWVKDQMVLSPAKYQRQYEPCFYGWFEKSSFCGDRTNKEVWFVDRPKTSKDHPTMKPVELCNIGITNSSLNGATVFDPFLGSGTTLIACEQLDRICFGMEISPQYCEVICQRWEKFTGGMRLKID